MPGAHGNTKKSRRLTVAGLIVVTAGTLLMMAWAVFPTPAFATVDWDGNGVSNGELETERCDDSNTPYLFWIFTGEPGAGLTDVTLTVNGQNFDMDQPGGANSAWQGTTPFFDLNSLSASVDGVNGVLTLSHGCPGETTTSTSTTSTTETTTSSSTTETTTSSTTGTTTSGTTSTGTTTSGTTSTGTTTSGTTSTGTTTSGTTSVGPTTVTPTTDDETTTEEETVSPTTVTPGGVAFTGPENVVPLGALALTLLTSGSGLLWAGARRRRSDDQE